MRRSMLLVVAAVALANCSTLGDALEECFCGPRIGNAKIDALFTAADEVQSAASRVESKLDAAVVDLAVALDIPPTSSDTEVRDALCAAFDDAGATFEITYQPPVCESEVSIAAHAAAECEATVTPGEVDVECTGSCQGTCRASCTGECRVPTVSAYCEGTCHGRCEVPSLDVACYGVCHGTCTGTCSAIVGVSTCAGSCEGTCDGTCEVTVSGGCSGTCSGECEIDVQGGDCNARCEGTCEGHCEGRCEGEVTAPEVDADCEAQVTARAQAQVVCQPPAITYSNDITGVANITTVTHAVARIVAANAEVDQVLGAMVDFVGPFATVGGAVIEGEVDAGQAACATAHLDETGDALDEATSTLQTVVARQDLILTCL